MNICRRPNAGTDAVLKPLWLGHFTVGDSFS